MLQSIMIKTTKIFILAIVAILSLNTSLYADMFETSKYIMPNENGAVIIFDSDYCHYCAKLKNDLETNPRLHNIAKQFRIYSINGNRNDQFIYGNASVSVSTQQLSKYYEVRGTPTMVVFDTNYNKMIRIPGYIQPEVISTILELTKKVSHNKLTKEQFSKELNKFNQH